MARTQKRTRPLQPNETIDMTKLDFNPALVPPLADPINPTTSDVNNMLDGFFNAVGVDTGAVLAQVFGDNMVEA